VPVVHVSPAQHGSPDFPHDAQVCVGPIVRAHTSEVPVHISPAQQGWPAIPHAPQTSPVQPRPLLQTSWAQQAWPEAPHSPQTSEFVQPPLEHMSPAQQGCPAAPHWAHVPPWQARVESEQASSLQQG
jgi:hypothetical protein